MCIKLPVNVLKMGLSGNAVKVYCCLLACADKGHAATVRMGKIAAHCNISRSTVAASVQQLAAAELVVCRNQYKADGTYRSNCYKLAGVFGRWCSVPFTALQLPGSVFVTYAALRSFANKAGRCFPSLSALEAMLGLCRNTIVAAIKHLQLEGLLRKAQQWAGKHNLYVLTQMGIKNECPALDQLNTRSNTLDSTSNKPIVARAFDVVKGGVELFLIFFKLWVVHFLYNVPIPTCNATKKRRNLALKYLLRDKCRQIIQRKKAAVWQSCTKKKGDEKHAQKITRRTRRPAPSILPEK